jgi:hypothetical protein
MSNNNNNNDNSKKNILLKQSDRLKQTGLVTKSVYYIDTHDIKISLNHNTCTDIIFTIDCKKWQNNLNTITEMAEENGIHHIELKRLLKNHLNDNHDEILEANNNEDSKQKPEFVTFKYSQMGKGDLHEAVLVNGLPFFTKYNCDSRQLELVEKIEENSRILRPPEREEYPYTTYEFETSCCTY